MSNRVLGICKAQGRGGLAVQLLQLGSQLAPEGGEGMPWPGPGPYWAAMEAVRRARLPACLPAYLLACLLTLLAASVWHASENSHGSRLLAAAAAAYVCTAVVLG